MRHTLVLPLLCILAGVQAIGRQRRQGYGREDPLAAVGATVADGSSKSTTQTQASGRSKRFLIATFPKMRQVAYVSPPDDVWRPLVVGTVVEPGGIAIDSQGRRLYIADPGSKAIWWYQLRVGSTGLLETTGVQKAAVEGCEAQWLAVNPVGDLYFTGTMEGSANSTSSIFRQDAKNIAGGQTRKAVEVYTRSNSGMPSPKAWTPSGVAVDSVYIFWGNTQEGSSHGSVVKGSRENIGLLSQDKQLKTLSYAADDVRGVCTTGTHVFFLSSKGIYGVLKSSSKASADSAQGLLCPSPITSDGSVSPWNPTGLAWDGDNSLFLTDSEYGVIYTLPSLNIQQHNLTRFTEAPGSHGLAFISITTGVGSAAREVFPNASIFGRQPCLILMLLGLLLALATSSSPHAA
mmetsp:Transcript_86837/g.190705  ORF Transcript_86837/g.190705 Transcript_86837/m.190705 type:complete len:404 (-) Transcript_86837:6-1217(-)